MSFLGKLFGAVPTTPAHRAFGAAESKLLRRVRPPAAGLDVSAMAVPPEANPGVRLIADFVTPSEEQEVVAAALGMVRSHGVSQVTDEHREFYEMQMDHLRRPPDVS